MKTNNETQKIAVATVRPRCHLGVRRGQERRSGPVAAEQPQTLLSEDSTPAGAPGSRIGLVLGLAEGPGVPGSAQVPYSVLPYQPLVDALATSLWLRWLTPESCSLVLKHIPEVAGSRPMRPASPRGRRALGGRTQELAAPRSMRRLIHVSLGCRPCPHSRGTQGLLPQT